MIIPENNLTAQPGRKCVVYLNISPHVVWYRSVCQINKGVSAMRGIFSCQMYNRGCMKHVFLWTERENLTCHITTFQKSRTKPWGTNFTKFSNITWVFGSKAHSKTQIGHEICYILRVSSQIVYDDNVNGRKAVFGMYKATSICIFFTLIAAIRCFVNLTDCFNSLKCQIHDCGNSWELTCTA